MSSRAIPLRRFCYSGGFALNAAAGGASRVVAVDSSQPALEEAHVNSARNNLEGIIEFVKDDALKYMKVRSVAVISAMAYSTTMAYAMVASVYWGRIASC